jgi:glycosyltransferase involved in cell wall biosynthesis
VKILIVTQWFDPEPTFKGLLFAKELVKAGHQVEVITGFPNYPGGKIYGGYKLSFYNKELIDGVNVHRVPLYPSHDDSGLKRVANYISFAISSLLCGLFTVNRPDVIYSYHPPLTTALSASLISFFRRAPLVVDIQDLWPDTLAATGMLNNKKGLALVEVFCQFVYKRASKIVVLSPGFKKRLLERNVPEVKVDVIYNWCDEGAIKNGVESSVVLPDNGNFNVVFAGNLGKAQGLPSLIDAAKVLTDKGVKANLIFIGSGVVKAAAEQQVNDDILKNVFFLPRVPMNEIGSLLERADALLVHLTNNKLFSITIPSRTQAYLAVGKPIIMAVNGDAANLIEVARAGVVARSEDPESIALAIESLTNLSIGELDTLSQNGKSFYTKELSVNTGVSKFINVFEQVIK